MIVLNLMRKRRRLLEMRSREWINTVHLERDSPRRRIPFIDRRLDFNSSIVYICSNRTCIR